MRILSEDSPFRSRNFAPHLLLYGINIGIGMMAGMEVAFVARQMFSLGENISSWNSSPQNLEQLGARISSWKSSQNLLTLFTWGIYWGAIYGWAKGFIRWQFIDGGNVLHPKPSQILKQTLPGIPFVGQITL